MLIEGAGSQRSVDRPRPIAQSRRSHRSVKQVISSVVAEDKPVHVLQLSRAEAEAKYGQAMYNNRHPVSLCVD